MAGALRKDMDGRRGKRGGGEEAWAMTAVQECRARWGGFFCECVCWALKTVLVMVWEVFNKFDVDVMKRIVLVVFSRIRKR